MLKTDLVENEVVENGMKCFNRPNLYFVYQSPVNVDVFFCIIKIENIGQTDLESNIIVLSLAF